MARRGDILDEFGNLTDPSEYDWEAPAPQDRRLGVTDPDTKSADPYPDQPSPDQVIDTSVVPWSEQNPFDPQPQPQAAAPKGAGGPPTGGSFSDPAFRRQFIAYYAAQPGVNPSVINDPGYWDRRLASGDFKDDYAYTGARMMQPEGPSEGSTVPSDSGGGGVARESPGVQITPLQDPTTATARETPGFQPTAAPTVTTPGSVAPTASAAPSPTSGLESLLMQLLTTRAGAQSAAASKLRGQINDQITRGSAPVTDDDPVIGPQVDSYGGDIQRSLDQFREMAAERAHAQGVGTGAFDAQIGNATLSGGRAVGDFRNKLKSTELTARRKMLSDALTQSQGLLSDQETNDLRNRIASIDGILGTFGARTSAKSVDNQGRSIDDQFTLGVGNLANNSRGLDNQEEAIGNQDTQFYDNLGSNLSTHAHDLDTILSQLLLSGG